MLRHAVGVHRRSKKVDPNKQDVKAVDKLIADRIMGSSTGTADPPARLQLPKFIRKSIAKQTWSSPTRTSDRHLSPSRRWQPNVASG